MASKKFTKRETLSQPEDTVKKDDDKVDQINSIEEEGKRLVRDSAPKADETQISHYQSVSVKPALESEATVIETYKTLRTNISFYGPDVRVIGITSSIENEGKSTVALNLAAQLAQTGKKVLFIDADLRKSVLLRRIRAKGKFAGLTNFLAGNNTLEQTLVHTDTEGLWLMFTGPVPPNPAELLGSRYFEKMIECLRNTFDYIVIDTSPLGAVIDSAVVSKVCDGMIIVSQYNDVTFKVINQIKNQLEIADAKILGVVINKIPTGRHSYYGYGHYGDYYGSYGNYGNSK